MPRVPELGADVLHDFQSILQRMLGQRLGNAAWIGTVDRRVYQRSIRDRHAWQQVRWRQLDRRQRRKRIREWSDEQGGDDRQPEATDGSGHGRYLAWGPERRGSESAAE